MANIANASDNDNDLIGDHNALHWAERFDSYFTIQRKDGVPVTTFDLMHTWFAGAIETGRMRDGTIIGYKAFGSIYDPKDVTIIRQPPE